MKPAQPAEAATLEALYRGYHGWLLSWLRRRVNCSQHAADVAHDTFIRLLSASPYVAPREPQAYLATVARRLLMDSNRRRRLERAYQEELERCAQYLEQAPSPEQILQAVQVLEAIDRALARMKPRIRETFILRHLDGLDQAQIAERLGVSVRTVQQDLVEALLACDACAQA
ncbi:sigma-70 family RNA polymerase sigma factor [Pseudomonas sp. WS 5111]|jgi:RNA polymerase sigma-70 factor (ECF subfamily)|uniref:sigma-70 family RNA polymerase sigma factor n=1 Tax=unclassified Pseudomonas TaxID=196821 RepID=UPI0014764BCE|nr:MULTISPECIES: sigma-70 family RNA polymerase sigma factor [unclassified Pseudomonas]NMX60664.1 sigma-70 family RNA polymerase sigma factor [Pseudomonas sp. WS 5079]NMX66929.1 sigma-70 family RNA polymerase sigma factor [Pseudomonas sp. WS 5111]NMX84993.1 sigma-70 family RNA polymerase sigma factor [Pseudomonas sp. WS 5010]NMY25795.1 sigma-70 family RNA polymerase sigma factor [Pseudomonas sp. WS 5021]